MPLYKYSNYTPSIADNCFISDSSQVIGRAELSSGVNVWFGTVIRADVNKISIGDNTNIQDLSMLHVTEENDLRIGSGVTVGHSVTLHACEIQNNCLIGMGAVVLDGAIIGEGSVVAAGSVVPPGKVYPKHSMILGNPAKVHRELRPEEIEMYSNHYKSYLKYAEDFRNPEIFSKI
ncbi:MAG: gamma carbonic anhydrase family protein [Halobacteriovoraceae bacterium]|nr:gamma carbonic anhydrase family protein [Halobacteriovoraceae bacterium]|tara:strand:+ start:6876 stop:7403 length:528 start_codon:yes stop_codon:yes gene_type:complete